MLILPFVCGRTIKSKLLSCLMCTAVIIVNVVKWVTLATYLVVVMTALACVMSTLF